MTDEKLIQQLIAAAPNWVAAQSRSGAKVQVIANPLRASEAPTRIYELSIIVKDNRVHVREESNAPLLPQFCPQRHLNEDGTFCLGLNAGGNLIDPQHARAWWKKLLVFLTCQDTAWETRTWPPDIEISHGEAGITEVFAEGVAEELGLLEEYRRAIRENTGIIATTAKRLKKGAERLRNGRAACICGRKKKSGHLKLRRECHADDDPCLPILEARRRIEEQNFWEGFKGRYKCCGTMDSCPLNKN